MKKSGFSYLELIICMSLVTAVVMLAMPVSTQTKNSIGDPHGEFRCYAIGNSLYQQESFNGSKLSDIKDVTGSGCIFSRPSGVNSYSITLIGAGGGGSKPLVPGDEIEGINQIVDRVNSVSTKDNIRSSNVSIINDNRLSKKGSNYFLRISKGHYTMDVKVIKYLRKEIQRAIALYPGKGGELGEVVNKNVSLSHSFNNDEIVINFCKNTDISTKEREFDFCIGKGGSGGTGLDLSNYYALLGIIHDLVYSRMDKSVLYTGYGDGALNDYDLALMQSICKNSNAAYNKARSSLEKYMNDNTSTNAFNEAYKDMVALASNINNLNRSIFKSDGFNGGYTRFKTSETTDLIARGGKGGSSGTNLTYLFKNSENSSQSTSGSGNRTFYIQSGGKGKSDNTYSNNTIGQGATCSCVNNKCVNCTPSACQRFGSGGGGGSIAFRTGQNLSGTYNNITYFLENDKKLNASDNLNGSAITKLEVSNNPNNIGVNRFYAGNGGTGGGGAIIITW